MGYVTLTELAKLTNPDLQVGVYAGVVTPDQFIAHIPFLTNLGGAYTYNRENALGDIDVFDTPGTPITAVNQATFTQKTSVPKEFVGNANIELYGKDGMSDVQDQAGVQVRSKIKQLLRQLGQAVIYGRSDLTLTKGTEHAIEIGASGVYSNDSNESDSLMSLCEASQMSWGANGGTTIALTHLTELEANCDPQPNAFVVSKKAYIKIKSLIAAAGGTTSEQIQLPNFKNPDGSPIQALAYDGIPIFRTNWLPDNLDDGQGNTDSTMIFAVYLGEDGFHGIAKAVPDGTAEDIISVRGPIANTTALGDTYQVYAWVNFVLKSKYCLAGYGRLNTA